MAKTIPTIKYNLVTFHITLFLLVSEILLFTRFRYFNFTQFVVSHPRKCEILVKTD